jgi:hypothetical protein
MRKRCNPPEHYARNNIVRDQIQVEARPYHASTVRLNAPHKHRRIEPDSKWVLPLP